MHAQANNGASEDHHSSELTATVSQYFNDESELGDLEGSALRSTFDNESSPNAQSVISTFKASPHNCDRTIGDLWDCAMDLEARDVGRQVL